MLKGKRISILGDSISTYKNVSNDINANSTIFGNPYFYCEPFPLEKTYWSLLIEKFGLSLCVNNSWSGGNLSGRNDFDSGINRAKNLSRNDGSKPDIIIVFIGISALGLLKLKHLTFSKITQCTGEKTYHCSVIA